MKIGKQALVFVGTKPSAEKTAEDISKKLLLEDPSETEELSKTSDLVLKALQSPTKQCERLASTVAKGVAFHHAGLASKQREILEEKV